MKKERRELDADPRTEEEKAADESVLAAFERGEILRVSPERLRSARMRAAARRRLRQETKELAMMLGDLRRLRGITQAALAEEIGSDKTDVSRAESGRHAPSMERFIATIRAIERLSGRPVSDPRDATLEDLYGTFETLEEAIDRKPLEEVA